jgi:hypothetical protein
MRRVDFASDAGWILSAATMTTPLTASNLDLLVIHAPAVEQRRKDVLFPFQMIQRPAGA